MLGIAQYRCWGSLGGEAGLIQPHLGPGNTRSDFLTTAGGPTATLSFNGGTTNGVGQFVIGTFIANAATQAITITSPATESSQIGAFELRQLPEPTSFALLAVGGLFLSRRVRPM